ncbi:hypothetical protein GTH50_03335 [Lactobacillus gasseri]|nr:hypothetical protein [Lactobacillus gasseri]
MILIKCPIFGSLQCLINLLVLIVRYTASDIGTFFSWDYPLIWAFILGCIFCILAVFWPKKNK